MTIFVSSCTRKRSKELLLVEKRVEYSCKLQSAEAVSNLNVKYQKNAKLLARKVLKFLTDGILKHLKKPRINVSHHVKWILKVILNC